MAFGGRMAGGAKILAGPGFTGHPEPLAHALDRTLSGMVAGLEEVADCPSAAVDLPPGLAPDERLSRFCEAIALMGAPLLEGLAEAFAQAGRESGYSAGRHLDLWRERADALIDYLEELARVHGVAFATMTAPLAPEAADAALAALRRRLHDMAEQAVRRALG
ncbi:MAG: hypothetical protein Kow00104_18840 [Rhodothalassiaceae bacterium]